MDFPLLRRPTLESPLLLKLQDQPEGLQCMICGKSAISWEEVSFHWKAAQYLIHTLQIEASCGAGLKLRL